MLTALSVANVNLADIIMSNRLRLSAFEFNWIANKQKPKEQYKWNFLVDKSVLFFCFIKLTHPKEEGKIIEKHSTRTAVHKI